MTDKTIKQRVDKLFRAWQQLDTHLTGLRQIEKEFFFNIEGIRERLERLDNDSEINNRIEAIKQRVEDMKPLWNKMQSVDDLRFLLEEVDRLKRPKSLIVNFKRLRDDAIVPQYQTPGAAGFDFHALESGILPPGEHAVIPTGLAVELPPGYVLLLFARSGNAMRYGITLSNGVGVCDQDYRGEIKALLYNAGHHPFRIEKGDRIMQGVIVPYVQAEFVEVAELGETARGEGGFGSTGAK